MKKFIFTAFAVILAANTVYGRVFGFGVKAGVDMPKLSTDVATATTSMSFGGFHAGVLAEVIIPIVGIGVQPELLYVNKQVAGMIDRTHSLEIPLNISWGINLHILDIRPFVLVAPTFTYAFNKMAVLSLDNNSTGLSIPTFKQTAWGIALGAGLDIWKLQVMLKWKWGISDILPDIPTDVNDAYKLLNNNKDFGSKLKENTFSISLGYIF